MGQHESRPSVYSKRQRSEDMLDDEPEDQPVKRHKEHAVAIDGMQPRETIIIEDGDEPAVIRKGSGTRYDPITLNELVTGNVITIHDDVVVSLISDDEGGSARSPTPLRPSMPIRAPTPESSVDNIYDTDDDTIRTSSPRLDELDANDEETDRSSRESISTASSTPCRTLSSRLELRFNDFGIPLEEAPGSPVGGALFDDDDEEHIFKDFVIPSRSPTPNSTPTPEPDLHVNRTAPDYGQTPKHGSNRVPFDEKDELDDEDGTSCYIVIDNEDEDDETDVARISSQIPFWEDWEESGLIKREPEDDFRDLTLSQETVLDQDPETPGSSQNTTRSSAQVFSQTLTSQSYEAARSPEPLKLPSSLAELNEKLRKNKEQREKTKYKKRLFYDTYAATMATKLGQLKDKFVGDLATTNGVDECWIYTGSGWTGSRQSITVSVGFRHKDERHNLCINLAFVIMLLDGLLTTEAKEGIVEEWWHASHLCGNWRCVNVRHIYPEPGPINSSRNACFHGYTQLCPHDPPCRKHLTVPNGSGKRATKEDPGTPSDVGGASLASRDFW